MPALSTYALRTLTHRAGVDASGNVGLSGEVSWPPRRALVIGDSLANLNIIDDGTHYGYQQNGVLSAYNQRYGHKLFLDLALNKGVSGNTTTQMLARYDADVAANYDSFDIALIIGGVNDYGNSIMAATTLSNIQTMVSALLNAGKWVVLFTLPPNNGGGGSIDQTMAYLNVNSHLRNYVKTVSTKTPLFLIDTWRDQSDPASSIGAPATGTTIDGTHLSALGGSLWARRMNATMGTWLDAVDITNTSQAEAYHASFNPLGNLLDNPGFATTSGGNGFGVGGTIVGSWTAERDGGSFTSAEVVGSVVTTPAGFGAAGGNKQRFTISIAGKSSNELLNFFPTSPAAVVVGGTYVLSAKVDISNISNLKMVLADLYFAGAGKEVVDGWNPDGGFMPSDDRTLYLWTPPFVAPPGSTGLSPFFTTVLDGSAAASVTMDIYDVMAQRVA